MPDWRALSLATGLSVEMCVTASIEGAGNSREAKVLGGRAAEFETSLVGPGCGSLSKRSEERFSILASGFGGVVWLLPAAGTDDMGRLRRLMKAMSGRGALDVCVMLKHHFVVSRHTRQPI
jgi:hypothetical protein